MKIKVKKLHKDAILPKQAKQGDAGFDLTAVSRETTWELCAYGCGLAFEIPQGYVGLVFPRSSIKNTELRLSNAVGVIDSGYRGEVMAVFDRVADSDGYPYAIGDRFAQMVIVPIPQVEIEEVEELSDSERGTGGYGSTGR